MERTLTQALHNVEELVNVRIALKKSISEKHGSSQIEHLGIVGLLTAFLHRDILWPTGRPILQTSYDEAKYLQLGHILVYVGYCNGCVLQRGFDSTNYVTP